MKKIKIILAAIIYLLTVLIISVKDTLADIDPDLVKIIDKQRHYQSPKPQQSLISTLLQSEYIIIGSVVLIIVALALIVLLKIRNKK
jgi:hypothetical protein